MAQNKKQFKKVVILGIDAMDPKITEQLIREGRLPNFAYLAQVGAYSHLATTNPPESAVAWTSFATGVKPAGHGIFDFIMRNPDNYSPYLSLNEIYSSKNHQKIQTRRKADGFWSVLSRNKIPSLVYFCPNTFPPEKITGKMLSGMGTPDITGTMGRYSFYTTRPPSEKDKNAHGKIIRVTPLNNIIKSGIFGPKVTANGITKESFVPFKIIIDADNKQATLEFQGNHIVLNESDWSKWQGVSFKIGLFKKAYGITKFYLKSIRPVFELYMVPVNFDPRQPLFPISYPKDYSAKLAKQIGLYYTQGIPYDTWALTEGALDEKAYLEFTDDILSNYEFVFDKGFKEFKGGVFYFYLGTLDVLQHMFWRYIDPKHPLYENSSAYKDTIFKYYEKVDRFLGDVLRKLDADTTLIVLSDHGFSSFRRSVHINRWLLDNGYLFLQEGKNESGEFLEDVDWSRTKAYAVGFGGIYLNRIGREYYGIVNDSEVRQLKDDIVKGLKELNDPKDGERVVNNVYTQEEAFDGKYAKDAPDLFVGFNAGYRASWQTALGGVPGILIEDNKKKWSGDHLIDTALVPGVLFVNKRAKLDNPAIIDIASTVLNLFGINDEKIQGKIIFFDQGKG